MGDSVSTPAMAGIRRRVLNWYAHARRDLPWRRSRDPYAIWISEIMLQQTRVDAVIPYYERFLARFPTVAALAHAPVDEVLRAWAGLGYYTRARNLHAAARAIVERHAGRFPQAAAAIRALPGIGPYTAGAIASIAFDIPAPIVDGNVSRVFARWFRVEEDVQSPGAMRRMWTWAEQWANTPAPGEANQALMELGALVCTKPVPACGHCPVRSLCAAHAAGLQASLPRPRRRPVSQRVHLDVLLAERGTRLLLVRRASGTLLHGWWEAPSAAGRIASVPGAARPARPARSARPVRTALPSIFESASARLGCRFSHGARAGSIRHAILQNDLHVTIWHARATGAARAAAVQTSGATPGAAARAARTAAGIANLNLGTLDVRWVTAAECRALPLATLTRKALGVAAQAQARWARFLPAESAVPAPSRRQPATRSGGRREARSSGQHLRPRASRSPERGL